MRNQVRKIIECSNKYSAEKVTQIPDKYLVSNNEQKNVSSLLTKISNESQCIQVSKKNKSQLSNLKLLLQWQQKSKSKSHLYTQNQQQPIFISIKHLNISQKVSFFKRHSSVFKKKGQIFPLRAKTFRKNSQTHSENAEKIQLYTTRDQKSCITPIVHNLLTTNSQVNTSVIENQEVTKFNLDANNQTIKNIGQINKPLTLRQQRIKRKNMMTKNRQKFSIKTEENVQMKVQSQRPFIRQKAISLLGISKKMSLHVCESSTRKYSAVGLIVLGKKSSKEQVLCNK